jgi:hypothetical protein
LQVAVWVGVPLGNESVSLLEYEKYLRDGFPHLLSEPIVSAPTESKVRDAVSRADWMDLLLDEFDDPNALLVLVQELLDCPLVSQQDRTSHVTLVISCHV